MILIGRDLLHAFIQRQAPSRGRIQAWVGIVEQATWRTPQDIKAASRSADILPGNRVVFDIGGNRYRIIVVVQYRAGVVEVRFVGTHAEYDRVNAEEV